MKEMQFDGTFGLEEDESVEVIAKTSIKGVCVRDGMILMIGTNRGDYIFPGGRIEENEGHEETLERELLEETGYTCVKVGPLLGRTHLRKRDKYESHKVYDLTSYFYQCEISEDHCEPSLTESEKKWSLEPVWVSFDEAIAENRKYADSLPYGDAWSDKVNFVLTQVRDMHR